jgi:hypothetical protein
MTRIVRRGGHPAGTDAAGGDAQRRGTFVVLPRMTPLLNGSEAVTAMVEEDGYACRMD